MFALNLIFGISLPFGSTLLINAITHRQFIVDAADADGSPGYRN